MAPFLCSRCSARLVPGDRFCPECGGAIQVAEGPTATRVPWLQRTSRPARTMLLATPHGAALPAPPIVRIPAASPSSTRRRMLHRLLFALAAGIAVAAGIVTWQAIETFDRDSSGNGPRSTLPGAAAVPETDDTATAQPEVVASPVASVPEPTATAPAASAPIEEPIATEPADTVRSHPAQTPTPAPEPTEDPNLPTEIDVPVDNLTPTPSPEEGEDPDLPTEIDVPVDNLTPTPYPEEGEDYTLPTEIDVPVDNLTPTPAPGARGPYAEEGEDYSLPTEIDVPVDNLPDTPGIGDS
jgi:hypothetical protein